MIDFTVAIPTYNRAKYLSQILDKLQAQTGIEHLNWEIIIIDNNSTDNTADVIKEYQASWNYKFPLKYYFEEKQGLVFARLRAIREAQGELIGFLDDDNLPTPDWIAQGYLFSKEYPQAAVWSGQIHGDYEVTPPENFDRIKAFMAIREHGNKPFLFQPDILRLPPGAAFVVRKQVWCDCVPSQLALTGRVKGLLVSGEDYEAFLYIYKAGWEIWYNPAMHTYHQIPHHRLEKDYLIKLAWGCGLCHCTLRLINVKEWQKPIVALKIFLSNLRRVLRHLFQYKTQLKSDVIARFEIEFYFSSMIGTFIALKRYFRNFIGNTKNENVTIKQT